MRKRNKQKESWVDTTSMKCQGLKSKKFDFYLEVSN